MSDPSTIVYHFFQILNTDIPSIFWWQEMQKTYTQRHNNKQIINKNDSNILTPIHRRLYYLIYTSPRSRCLRHIHRGPQILMWPLLGWILIWSKQWENKYNHNEASNQVESNDLFTDSHVSDARWFVLIDLWTVNPQLSFTSPLAYFPPKPQNHQKQIAVIYSRNVPLLQATPDGLTKLSSLSTNLPLENKRRMHYFPREIRELNIHRLIDTGALSSVILVADLLIIH